MCYGWIIVLVSRRISLNHLRWRMCHHVTKIVWSSFKSMLSPNFWSKCHDLLRHTQVCNVLEPVYHPLYSTAWMRNWVTCPNIIWYRTFSCSIVCTCDLINNCLQLVCLFICSSDLCDLFIFKFQLFDLIFYFILKNSNHSMSFAFGVTCISMDNC